MDVFRYLVDAGADLHVRDDRGSTLGFSCLLRAIVEAYDHKLVSWLLEKAHVDINETPGEAHQTSLLLSSLMVRL